MKIHFTFFAFFLFFSITAFAQSDREDVIYLKNGSVYRGTIIEQIPSVSYKIEIAGGSVIVVKAEDVEKVTLEKKASVTGHYLSSEKPSPIFKYRNKGYFFQARITFPSAVGLSVINGYKFGQFGQVGIGVGIYETFLYIPQKIFALNEGFLPLFIYYGGDIWPKRITPFYSITAGYGFALNPNRVENVYDYSGLIKTQGGPTGEVCFGIRIYAGRKRVNISFAIILDVQQGSYWLNSNGFYPTGNNRSSGTQFIYMPGTSFSIGF